MGLRSLQKFGGIFFIFIYWVTWKLRPYLAAAHCGVLGRGILLYYNIIYFRLVQRAKIHGYIFKENILWISRTTVILFLTSAAPAELLIFYPAVAWQPPGMGLRSLQKLGELNIVNAYLGLNRFKIVII